MVRTVLTAAVPVGVTEDGLKLQVTPEGTPLQANVVVKANPVPGVR
jgi:hypothetical protein